MVSSVQERHRLLQSSREFTLSVDTSSAASSRLRVEIWSTIWLILGETAAFDEDCSAGAAAVEDELDAAGVA